MSEPQVEKLQTNERAKEVRPHVDTVKDGVDAKHAGTTAKGKDEHAAKHLAKVGAANEEANGEGHGHGPHLDLHALGEEQIRDVVFFRGKTWLSPTQSVDRADGALAGLQRYDGKTPRRPKADAPDQDQDYDHELWHHAMHRLEEIAIQSEAGGEVEYHQRVGVSTNNASRAERREADEKLSSAKERVEEKENTKGHAGIGAAKRAENRADKERDKVYDKTRDPLGEAKEKAENAEEHEKTKTAAEQREA
ncbi:MAG: hypothetical protein NT062_28360, partial [Proteobacteria bacterium]|nr:hypothetical protein [Pseudomonadota bacterium]